jgi:hypothetical protein
MRRHAGPQATLHFVSAQYGGFRQEETLVTAHFSRDRLHQIEFRRLLNRHIGRLIALENPTSINTYPTMRFGNIATVAGTPPVNVIDGRLNF